MSIASQLVVDYSLAAKTALDAVERFTADIEAAPSKVRMCREKWKDYGAALLSQRAVMPNNKVFGAWVKEHGLDGGLASSPVTRSNAMWLSDNWERVLDCTLKRDDHHPVNIRQACRAAGYAWAGERAERKAKREQKKKTKRAPRETEWQKQDKPFKGPTIKEVRKQWPLLGAIEKFVVATETHPVKPIIEGMRRTYEVNRWGLDQHLVDRIRAARDWLNDLVDGVQPLAVVCRVKRGKRKC